MTQPNIDKTQHRQLAAWFLGPKGENEEEFLSLITSALNGHTDWRRSYFPTDPGYVSAAVKGSKEFKDQMIKIHEELNKLNLRMRNSLPSFSARYKGHMNWEVSMPGLLGYFTAMLYNQNNVATEASAVTTVIEQEVGDDLCKMLQFRSHWEGFTPATTAWGHITSCGSVANFEGAWAARNVKYLTYTIRKAIFTPENPTGGEGKDLKVKQANDALVPIAELDPSVPEKLWILLNIPADNALELLHQYGNILGGIQVALKKVRPYGPQTKGIAAMPGEPAYYYVPATAHYSWAKSGALLGIGEDRMVRVPVDQWGRLDTGELETRLTEKANSKIPVFYAVAILGSTTEGSMDPIAEVVNIRNRLRKSHNFDFNIHADAAWGGYCASMLDPPVPDAARMRVAASRSSFVPVSQLSNHVRTQLQHVYLADSVTIDPHKSGYIQYPAGAICYANKRMRDMLAYQAPYITPSLGNYEDPSVGTYGIDGSRAGAAAVATYLHHRVTGLTPQGHGMLVGQANFTAKKIWALLATMAGENDPFIISQIQQPTPEMIPQLKRALVLSNDELVYNNELMTLLQEHGPDFLINVFAINFAYPVLNINNTARTWNTTLQDSMDLMGKIGAQLNTPYGQYDPDTTRPKGVSRKGLFIIRDTLFSETYSKAIKALTGAIKLNYNPETDPQYSFLVSTNMDPWTTATGFLRIFHSELRQAILKGIAELKDPSSKFSFVLVDASDAEVFGNLLPSFHIPEQNYQSVAKFEFGLANGDGTYSGNESIKFTALNAYRAAVLENPAYQPCILVNKNKEKLEKLLYGTETEDYWFEAELWAGKAGKLLGTFWVRSSDVILHHHFDPAARYPANEQYYVFGTNEVSYATHIITEYQNFFHLIQLQTTPPGVSDLLNNLGLSVTLAGITTENNRTANPLTVGFTYPIEGVRENNETFSSSLTVQSEILFDTSLNNSPPALVSGEITGPGHGHGHGHEHSHSHGHGHGHGH